MILGHLQDDLVIFWATCRASECSGHNPSAIRLSKLEGNGIRLGHQKHYVGNNDQSLWAWLHTRSTSYHSKHFRLLTVLFLRHLIRSKRLYPLPVRKLVSKTKLLVVNWQNQCWNRLHLTSHRHAMHPTGLHCYPNFYPDSGNDRWIYDDSKRMPTSLQQAHHHLHHRLACPYPCSCHAS